MSNENKIVVFLLGIVSVLSIGYIIYSELNNSSSLKNDDFNKEELCNKEEMCNAEQLCDKEELCKNVDNSEYLVKKYYNYLKKTRTDTEIISGYYFDFFLTQNGDVYYKLSEKHDYDIYCELKSFDEERFTLKEFRFNSEKHIGYKLNISDVILIDHISNIHNFSDEIYLFITETGEVTILSISLGTNSSCEGISYFMRKIDVENVIGLVDGNGIVEGNGDTLENYAYLIDINGKKYSVGKYLYN